MQIQFIFRIGTWQIWILYFLHSCYNSKCAVLYPLQNVSLYFWKSKSSLKTSLKCPYKAWKPQLVLASHLWHSPCKRPHTSAWLHQRPLKCHSMWKHPEHLIIMLIEPAHQIWGRHGLRLAYLCLRQHHVWLAPVHTGWTFRHHQALGAQPWLWRWCARLSSRAGLRKPSTLWRFTGTNQWSIECLGVFGGMPWLRSTWQSHQYGC